MKQLLAITSLLLSTALLLVGHGMQLTLLPLRNAALSLPESLIGASASLYFLGFVAGCFTIPKLIARIGHIRAFAVLSALMLSSILALDMLQNVASLFIFRFLTGVAICGLYSVIESWLNSQTTADTRGRILSIYTFVTLSSMTLGQLLINVGPITSSTPFMLSAVFVALAIIPIGMTRKMAPAPVESARASFRLLFNRSRSAFAAALLSGLVAGSFWSLGAVFSSSYSGDQIDITWFMSMGIAGGAILQYPIGWLSDKIDRRHVLILLCVGGTLSSAAVALSVLQSWHLVAVFLFGAMVMPLYAIALATVADVSSKDEFVTIGTTVLLTNALGAAMAPIVLGQVMSLLGATYLFWSFAGMCLLVGAYIALQLRDPRTVSIEAQVPFGMAAPDAAPNSFDLDPRATEDAPDTRQTAQEDLH
jgi:MFS family permease